MPFALLTALLIALLTALTLAATNAPAHAMAQVIIADGAVATQGGLSWGPDSVRFAFAGKRLTIYNTVSGKMRQAPVADPFYVNWLKDGRVAALFLEGDNTMLALLNPDTGRLARVVMPPGTVSVHDLPLEKDILLLAQAFKKTTLRGLETKHALYSLSPDGQIKERFATSHVYDSRNAELPAHRGWIASRPNPVDGRMLLLEFRSPPERNQYIKLSMVDPATGGKDEIYRASAGVTPLEGDFSPNGRRIALANSDGRLGIVSMDGSVKAVDDNLSGVSPAWSPAGSQIFFGGRVFDSDGSSKKEVLAKEPSARCFWRPDGTGMAVVSEGGTLLLLAGIINPSALKEDKPPSTGTMLKLRLLRELLYEGLITNADYTARRDSIQADPIDSVGRTK